MENHAIPATPGALEVHPVRRVVKPIHLPVSEKDQRGGEPVPHDAGGKTRMQRIDITKQEESAGMITAAARSPNGRREMNGQ